MRGLGFRVTGLPSSPGNLGNPVTWQPEVRVNGIDIYYEIHGAAHDGPPLVLLHGGDPSIETSFGRILPELAKRRRIVAFDQAGHGRTPDRPDQPFSFEQSADDAAALLEALGIDRADFYGYSNGGTIALQVAIRHPTLVRKLVVQSANFRSDGMVPELWEGMRKATLADMPAEYRDIYVRLSPHPERLQSYFEKSQQRMLQFKDIPAEAIKAIDAPVLIMIGDRDIIRPEHALELFRLLPHAQLAVLPDTDHMQMADRAAWEVPMIEAFLEGG